MPRRSLIFLFEMTPGGDNEVQRTMLEIVNQLDGFDAIGQVKMIMATNRCGLTTGVQRFPWLTAAGMPRSECWPIVKARDHVQ